VSTAKLNLRALVYVSTAKLNLQAVVYVSTPKLNLQALVYVSTAYSQCPHSEIKEVYPLPTEYMQIFDEKIVDEGTMMKVR
jgi:hypothetical protein